MYRKIWKEEQLQDFYVAFEIKQRIQELIDILCFYYGEERNVDMELGGFIAAFTDDSSLDTQQYQKLLRQYHLNEALPEYQETLLSERSPRPEWTWTETLFLCGSDFSIICTRPQWKKEVK